MNIHGTDQKKIEDNEKAIDRKEETEKNVENELIAFKTELANNKKRNSILRENIKKCEHNLKKYKPKRRNNKEAIEIRIIEQNKKNKNNFIYVKNILEEVKKNIIGCFEKNDKQWCIKLNNVLEKTKSSKLLESSLIGVYFKNGGWQASHYLSGIDTDKSYTYIIFYNFDFSIKKYLDFDETKLIAEEIKKYLENFKNNYLTLDNKECSNLL
jgi:hypothetical protein